ncbi:MAG: Single-stranded DNA-binding protein, partial [Myxococcaceae bacterium]|nr:Single-stranded DNA-binding protein [Myxococcaceae bacterium]
MDGINKVMIHGNLGADPELRMLPGGTAMLKLRVATNERWVD